MGGEGLNPGRTEEVTMKNFIDRLIGQPLQDFYLKLREFLPHLLSALAIFIIGLLLAWAVKAVIVRLFKLLRLDRLMARLGLAESLQKLGVKDAPTKFIGRVFYWLIVVIFFTIALTALKLPAVDALLERFLLYLPNVFIAALLLVLGLLIGNFLGRAALIASVNAGVKQSGLLSRAVKTTVVLFAFVMAMEQLGIGRQTVLAAFTIVFGGLVLALALAFGLAGKEIARSYLEETFKKKRTEEKGDEIKHL
jgi:Mechanosensitive ion channel, conserved TM helix